MWRKLTLLTFAVLVSFFCFGQDPLKQKLSVSFNNETVAEALQKISKVSGSQISFSPSILPEKRVTGNYNGQSLEKILNQVLGASYQYKVRGSFVIIQPSKKKEQPKAAEPGTIKGKIVDSKTGNSIAMASVYDVNKLKATLSEADGSYDLSPSESGEETVVAFSKENYRDTVITMRSGQDSVQDIVLQPLQDSLRKEKTPADRIKFLANLVSDEVRSHIRNINLEEDMIFQFSVIPGVGTNGNMSGVINNNISLNLIGGYNKGLNGFELGGVFNIIDEDVIGAQVAGAANVVGGTHQGAQIAGAFNMNKSGFIGAQIAGAMNSTSGKVTGVQIAGAVNIVEKLLGAQVSGAYGHLRDTAIGVQISGAMNLASHIYGAQVAGAYNQTQTIDGVQIAGAANRGRNVKGVQITSAYNHASDTLSGVQISGAVNHAGVLRGVQVGIVNVARESKSGLMIGLVNITRDGILAVDASNDDVTDYNLSFRSGTKRLYTIYAGGISFDESFIIAGAGLGSQFRLSKKFYTDLELSSHILFPVATSTSNYPIDSRFNLSLGYRFTERISINGGPVLHYFYFDETDGESLTLVETIGDNHFFDKADNGIVRKWWVGYRVAVRF